MSRAGRVLRLTGKAIKYSFVLLIVFICCFFIWRIFSSSDPSSMKALSPNAALAEAYEKDSSLEGMFRQEQRSITSAEENYGYFAITKATFIPSANQIQLLVRYNNSTIRATAEDFSLDAIPSRSEELYDVSLYVVTDLTPDDDSDNLTISPETTKEYRIKTSYMVSEEKNLYNFRLFVFDLGELSLSDLLADNTLLSIYTDIYYKDAIDYEKTPYGTLCIYDYITQKTDVRLSSADKKAIEEWISENK